MTNDQLLLAALRRNADRLDALGPDAWSPTPVIVEFLRELAKYIEENSDLVEGEIIETK